VTGGIAETGSPAGPTAGGPGRAGLAPILAVQFIGTLGFSIDLPFLVFLVTDFGGAPWTFGLIGATYSASQLVGAPLLGRWSDRYGRRPVLVISQAGTMAAWLVLLLALRLPLHALGAVGGATVTVPLVLTFAARMIDGLTGGNISVASAYVADVTRDDRLARRVAFGRMGMASSLGFTLGPALAGILMGMGDGYSGPVIAAAAISGAATILCLALREPAGRCPEGPPPQQALARVLGQQQRRCDTEEPLIEGASLRRPVILGLLLATFTQFLAFNLFYAAFPVHATGAVRWTAGRLGLFYSLLSAVLFVAQGPVLAAVSGRLAPRAVFALGLAGLIGAFATFVSTDTAILYLGATLFALGNGLAWPTFQARTADAATDREQGEVQGAAASAGALASIVGLTLGGLAYPWLGGSLFLVGAALFALVLLATPALFPESPHEA